MDNSEKFKLKRYCDNCKEETNIGSHIHKGIFYCQLEFASYQDDKKIIEKKKWYSKGIEKLIEKGWVLYKCPNCPNTVKYMYDEGKKDYVIYKA
jgi:predicted RNA-binding Zn-ribbon protein involved in translation (DUF1610 family)